MHFQKNSVIQCTEIIKREKNKRKKKINDMKDAYLEDNVGAGGSLKSPLAVGKLRISSVAIVEAGALDLSAVELVHVLGALRLAVELVAPVATVVLAVAEVSVIDTLAIAAVLGAPGAGLDLAHEGQQGLAPGELPLLAVLPQLALDTLALPDVWLVQRPVAFKEERVYCCCDNLILSHRSID